SSRRRHTRFSRDWSSDVCSSDLPTTAVVLITAYGDVEMAVRAIKAGARDFVLKPWENDKLLATLHSALEGSAGQTAKGPNGAAKIGRASRRGSETTTGE